jgi:hypothetical protein
MAFELPQGQKEYDARRERDRLAKLEQSKEAGKEHERRLLPDEKYIDQQDWWFAYECCKGDCPEAQEGRTGVVLDIRLSDPAGDRAAPEIPCPSCKRPMHFSARWRACSNGYGSRSSPCGGAKGENHIEDLQEGC